MKISFRKLPDIEKIMSNKKWYGLGMVSANNSSRLLLDYKELYPQKYDEIMNLMFGSEGLCINHLKIEMGADINSSSGTEPCTKRFKSEKCDVHRGAGFILCADAKKINPEIKLDMLWWSEPKWISESKNMYEDRYLWYKENLLQAYEQFRIKFDYVSATQNERAWDSEWIKFLSKKLKNDTQTPYDFSKIKVVAGDEVCTWNIADLMTDDSELCKAVDAIGSHYTSWNTENVEKLRSLGKEIWMSEGSSSMGYSKGVSRFDKKSNGLGGLNNVLDIASRLITMYAKGHMTMCEIQPVISAYYDGVCYCHKQFITANTPWNGKYYLDSGFFMALHFSQFIKKGWILLEEGCLGDGKPGGDGHCIVDSKFNCLTAINPETNDFSFVAANCSGESVEYELGIKTLKEKSYCKKLFLYDTASWENNRALIKKEFVYDEETEVIKFSVKPFSILTISSLDYSKSELILNNEDNYRCDESNEDVISSILPLPYRENFDYSNDFLFRRGNSPFFTTDQGGAFEVTEINGDKFLQQQVYFTDKANEWGCTSDPVTTFGDDRWMNYVFECEISFDSECRDLDNYAGIGIRNNIPADGKSGFILLLHQNGKWQFLRNSKEIISGELGKLHKENHLLVLGAENNRVFGEIDGICLFSKKCCELNISSAAGGRPSLYSAWNRNLFKNVKILPLGKHPYVRRYDDTDDVFDYEGKWNHSLMDSYKNYMRTISKGSAGAIVKIKYEGTGFYLIGINEEETQIMINNKIIKLPVTGNKEVLYEETGLKNEKHCIEIKVIKGNLQIDALEVLLNSVG